MKKLTSTIFLIFLTSLMACALFAQQSQNLEPEYIGKVVFLKKSTATPVEQQKVAEETKGYLVYTSISFVQGVTSPMRISKGDTLQFIARVGDNRVDPFQMFNIFKLDQNTKKKRRSVETGKMTIGSVEDGDVQMITFTAKKYGEESFLIIINQKLEPGEYAITLEGKRGLFNMFGID